MPQYTAITRRRVSVSLPSSSNLVSIGNVPLALPSEAGDGIDPAAADVGGDVWVVCIGVANDHVYLVKLSGGVPVDVSGEQARSSWIDEQGVVSWVPESDPYVVRYMGTSATTPSLDTKHPAWPVPGVIEQWGPVRVTQVHHSGDWASGEDADYPETRVWARYQGGPPLEVWRGYAPKPARIQAHSNGTATVCVQIPDGIDAAVFVPSSDFDTYAPDPVTVPAFVKVPQRCAVLVDGAPGVPWFADTSPQWIHGELGVLHTIGHGSLEQSVNLAVSTDRVLYLYADHGRPTREMFSGLPAYGAMPMVQCYPEQGETDAAFDARIRTTFNVVKARPFAVYACGYLALDSPEGTRTEQQVLNSLGIVNRAAAEYPTCRIVVVFTHERGLSDGVARFPSLQEAVSRFQAAVKQWDDYPTVDELTPDISVEPPPVDPPTEPEPPTKPEPPIEPPVQPEPIQEEFLMNGMTLYAADFRKVKDNVYVYPLKNGNFFSVETDTGKVRPEGTPNQLDSEQLVWVKGTRRATFRPGGGVLGVGFTFVVDETGV